MEDIFKYIGNYGFPIIVSIYLLIRFEDKIDKMAVVIQKMIEILKEIRDNNIKD